MLEISNYWDDFERRVSETVTALQNNSLPGLDRLTVHITQGCNLNCSYCNMHFSPRQMDEELVKKIIDDHATSGGKIIHFTGGEPTIVPYIEDVFAYAKSRGLQVSTNSNCVNRVDVSNVDKLKASFDTPFAEKFNTTVGMSCFGQVVDNLKYYSQDMKGKMLSITAVLNRQTYKDMLALAQFVQKNFRVYNLYFSNYKGCNPAMAFTDEEIQDMFENHIPKVLAFFKEHGCEYSYKQLSLYKPDDFRNVDVRFPDNLTVPCYIQLSEMTIDVNGWCNNCSHLQRDGVEPSKYNVKDMSVHECFQRLKADLQGQYTCLNCKCLNGCNTNLIGFNREVEKSLRET